MSTTPNCAALMSKTAFCYVSYILGARKKIDTPIFTVV
jgi:hypothetical protein